MSYYADYEGTARPRESGGVPRPASPVRSTPAYDAYDEYDEPSKLAYVTEEDLDDEFEQSPAETRCMCCGIREGMFINGFLILFMMLSSYFILAYLLAEERNVVAVIVGSNMKISSAYIMWFTGVIASIVSIVCPLALHPYGRRQFAYLNLVTTVVFLLAVAHHGWSAAHMAAVDLPSMVQKHLYKTRRNDAKDENVEKLAKLTFQIAIAMAFNALFNSTGGLDRRDVFALPFMVSKAFGIVFLCIFPAALVGVMAAFAGMFASDAKTKAAEFKARKRNAALLP